MCFTMFKLYNPKLSGTHKKVGGRLNKILFDQFIDLDIEFGQIPSYPQGHKHFNEVDWTIISRAGAVQVHQRPWHMASKMGLKFRKKERKKLILANKICH